MNTIDFRTNLIYRWLLAAVTAYVIVHFMLWFVVTPTQVKGDSMKPNFTDGQYVIVDRWAYWFAKPKRGDVVVFRTSAGDYYIKRVIALPGETVRVEGDHVYINGSLLREYYIEEEIQSYQAAGGYNHLDYPETLVPAGHVFVMGDNRPNSVDSRSLSVGMVPYSRIVGRADMIIWPYEDMQFIHHGDVEVLP